MDRHDVTEQIIAARIQKGLAWADIAKQAGASKEWVTAGCLGQMTFNQTQAAAIARLLGLPDEARKLLEVPPSRGTLSSAIPADPLIYRFYELVSVYGSTLKELIQEEFGDGIMSAIDFRMHLERERNPAGDRVKIVMSGKFLPYKEY